MRGIHFGVRIADFRETLRNRKYRELRRVAVRDLVPVKRCRNTGVRKWAYRICGACGPVLRVLVVVEEHAMALFFPPFRTGQCRRAAFYGARQGNRRAAYFSESPAWLDAHIYVHAA